MRVRTLTSTALVLFALSISSLVWAQTVDVTFRVSVPAETPLGDPVFIAGSFQGWDPGSLAHQLTDLGDGLYEITLAFAPATILQFKFTRGDWGKVEKGPSGEEIANRMHTVVDAAILDLTVARWADIPVGSTITGDVSQITVPGLLNGRRVWVYLPPDYDTEPTQSYPVLYMLDGQNVFDAATSFAGEWEVDESCESLIAAGEMRPIIVVAVANGELQRIHEYTPWFDPDFEGGLGGGGKAHIQEFISVLKPFIDANYRTQPGPASTGFSGSSLGGLMSAYVAHSHSETFGRIGAFSPSIQWKDYELLSWAAAQPKPDLLYYMDMGSLEGGGWDGDGNGVADIIDDLRALRDIALSQGFVQGTDLMVVEDEGALHNEFFWAARFPEAMKFLFPPTSVDAEPTSLGRFKSRFREGG